MAIFDQTFPVAAKGYAWLPDLRRGSHGRPIRTRVGGQRVTVIGGPAAAEFFYSDGNLERHTALPPFVVNTLFGRGAVHTLDGDAHRRRKALFVDLLMDDGIDMLTKLTEEMFDEAAGRWRGGPAISLFDETARILASAVTRWTGVQLTERDRETLAADLVAMVDGFATAGPRLPRALWARRRQERRFAEVIEDVRRQEPDDTAVSRVAHHLEEGYLLDARIAAVELLNVIRPTTAVTWLTAFAAHALDRWPANRGPLRAGDQDFAVAFAHELRRFYPFAPFLGGRATRALRFQNTEIPHGTLVLLDVYGQHHDERVWASPYTFRPERFLGRPIGAFELIPQGGGDPRTGHRCPGEKITIALLSALVQRLAKLNYHLPSQDDTIDLSRIPARPRSGMQLVVA